MPPFHRASRLTVVTGAVGTLVAGAGLAVIAGHPAVPRAAALTGAAAADRSATVEHTATGSVAGSSARAAATHGSATTHHGATARHARVEPAAVPAATARPAVDPALEDRLAAKMAHATAGRYGLVVDIAGVGRVATINPHGAMRPASTQKLFTTLPVLLDQPDIRLATTITSTATLTRGVLHGNLVVHASGDPSLLRRHLTGLGHQLRRAGVRRVTGGLRLDIGSLPTRTRQTGWHRDFVPADVGPLSPFPVYEDVWRHDKRYVAHPTRANLALLRSKLHDTGLRIHGSSDIVRSAPDGRVLAVHRSRPLGRLVHHTLKISDNFYAEQLLVVGGGHARVNRLIAAAGITDKSYATDGSGLSYDDRESPAGEVTLLDYARTTSAYGALHADLPVACRNGTLEHRFCKTPGAGEVFAKTGTLTHTTALAGYTTDGLGREVTFSVIAAGVRNVYAAQKATDRAVLVLRRYTG